MSIYYKMKMCQDLALQVECLRAELARDIKDTLLDLKIQSFVFKGPEPDAMNAEPE